MNSIDLRIETVRTAFPLLHITRVLGQGAYKVVFEAFREGEVFALKILKEEIDYNRLVREASTMRLIDSPYIAKLFEFQILQVGSASVPYLLEEYIEGKSLNDELQQRRIIPPIQVVQFLDQALQGLEAMWAKRIVHRDIKPDNIMLRGNGSPVIVDFGLSRHLDLTSLTPSEAHGTMMGTPAFAPPELLRYDKSLIDSIPSPIMQHFEAARVGECRLKPKNAARGGK